ncbi:hypothetical protein PHLH4_22480 [Pseudomonas sp. St316]|nr:hypothetical protein PHLH4_22480 [Pseudomonas sp. St316]
MPVNNPKKTLGASLLANRPAHPTSPETDTPPSRASSLPHGFFGSHKTHTHRRTLWELSLLAIAVGLLASMLNVPPHREQARLPQGFLGFHDPASPHPSNSFSVPPRLAWGVFLPQGLGMGAMPVNNLKKRWERACSRIGRHIQHHQKLIHRHREQAQLPHGFFGSHKTHTHRRTLWELSLLAIAEGLLASMLNVPPHREQARLPQGFLGFHDPAFTTPKQQAFSTAAPRLAGVSPTGIGDGCDACEQPEKTLGASLLANRPAHPTSPETDTPPSRAGSLPHGFSGSHKTHAHRRSLWELSLLAIAVGLLASMLNVPPPSRASSAPTGVLGFSRSCIHHTQTTGFQYHRASPGGGFSHRDWGWMRCL